MLSVPGVPVTPRWVQSKQTFYNQTPPFSQNWGLWVDNRDRSEGEALLQWSPPHLSIQMRSKEMREALVADDSEFQRPELWEFFHEYKTSTLAVGENSGLRKPDFKCQIHFIPTATSTSLVVVIIVVKVKGTLESCNRYGQMSQYDHIAMGQIFPTSGPGTRTGLWIIWLWAAQKKVLFWCIFK